MQRSELSAEKLPKYLGTINTKSENGSFFVLNFGDELCILALDRRLMMAEDTQRKMHRSPNHPFFDLAEAVTKVKIVYENEKRSSTSPEVIVKHLGYGALNGPGGRTLSGLRQYGLLEETSGRYKISDDAFALLHYSQESDQWRAAVRRAALAPTLYHDLYSMFPDLSASDETLRVTLLDKGFNPDVIERALRHFRSTMEFAGLPNGLYSDPKDETKMQIPLHSITTTETPDAPKFAVHPETTTGKSYSFAFAGNGRAELKVIGEYTVEDLEDLKDHLEVTLRGLVRSKKTEAQ
ncbi:MAG: hypothetical protein ACYC46_08415 [Acidobacteriaceae bacterium]